MRNFALPDMPPIEEWKAMAHVQARPLQLPGAVHVLAARLYAGAADVVSDGLVVFVPGEAFGVTDLDAGDGMARRLVVASGWHVLVCTHTPAAVRPFPAAAEDIYAALAWACAHRASLAWNGRRLVVAGLESGGNLAAAAAFMARDRGRPKLAGQVLILPMLDPSLATCSMRAAAQDAQGARAANGCACGYRRYLPRAVDRLHPYVAPLHARRLKGLAPALILSAENDPLRDEAELYGTHLERAGVAVVVSRLGPLHFDSRNPRAAVLVQRPLLQAFLAFLEELGSAAGTGETRL